MNPLRPLLDEQGVVVLDGGLATELEARGHDLSDELWSARLLRDDPAAIRAVHESYRDAGADCLTSASYQATLERLGAHALRLSVELARCGPLVAASVGPYGAALADGSEYTGLYPGMDEDSLYRWHRDRWCVLAQSGADLLACETLPSGPEARALLRLLEESSGTWAWFSFSCGDAEHLRDGTPLHECAALLDGCPRVAAIGVNCVAPRLVAPLVAEVKRATRKPVVAYPNSGERYDPAARAWSGGEDGADGAEWWTAGATIVGGCCRTGPDDIRRLRARLL